MTWIDVIKYGNAKVFLHAQGKKVDSYCIVYSLNITFKSERFLYRYYNRTLYGGFVKWDPTNKWNTSIVVLMLRTYNVLQKSTFK